MEKFWSRQPHIAKSYNAVSLFADRDKEKEYTQIGENHKQSLLILCRHPFLANISKAITSDALLEHRNISLLSSRCSSA